MSITTVRSFRDVSASATPDRFVHVTIGDQTFQMHPGTAGELRKQLENAHDLLLEMPYDSRITGARWRASDPLALDVTTADGSSVVALVEPLSLQQIHTLQNRIG